LKSNNKTNGKALYNHKPIEKPKPLPDTYRPPSDLNQYGAPLPTIDKTFNICSKLTYLEELLTKLYKKAQNNKTLLDKIKTHYEILESPDARLLISLFNRDIIAEERYYKRLATEFRLIKKKQFTKVFLQVMDILKISDSLGIPHIIRGSAGSSLICYLLKITDIDPIKENISLARFMHTQRNDLPDIDMDFPSNRRDEIYAEIFKRYGNKVARISNHVKYSEKTALKQAIRESGYRKFIPREYEITEIIQDTTKLADIYKRADELDGEFKNYSLHCGGIIIFDKPIPHEYILETHDENNTRMPDISWQQVILNKDQVDDYMFIKIDILSNRGLTELWDIDQRPIESYPFDAEVYKSLSNGENIGIVYAESRAMRKALIYLKPRDIQGIALALAIIRPVAREQKSAYFKDYNDYKAILDDIQTSDSSGCGGSNKPLDDGVKLGDYIIYDDDAIQIIQRLIGCTEADADVYRKAFAKGKWDKKREFERRLRYKHSNYSEERVKLILEQLDNLQAYSFCKSHAISYAKLVYALAYCRVHNPVEFWISALNNCNSSYRKWVYYREAAAIGIKLTRGYAPWTWCDKIIGIVSKSDRKIPITDVEDAAAVTVADKNRLEYFRLGYWCDENFIGDCYLKRDSEPTKKKKRIIDAAGNKQLLEEDVYLWRFKGLISNYRCCKTWKKIITSSNGQQTGQASQTVKERNITFVTIGYDNARYIDIVLYGKIGLGKCHMIEGYGVMVDENYAQWIKVEKWHLASI
jgi:DNA polymerase III alpha subunit